MTGPAKPDDPDNPLGALLIAAHEKQRARFATELHDDIGQRLAVLTMDLDALGQALPLPADEASERIREVSDRALKLAKDIQALSHRLYPSKLEYLGLASAATSFCRQASTRHQVDIAFSQSGVPGDIPMDVALALYRVMEEAVTNAVEHAGVDRVTVALEGGSDGQIQLHIADRGTGFDPDAASHSGAAGLLGMHERMRAIGGELIIESRPGAGTSVRARARIPGAAPSS